MIDDRSYNYSSDMEHYKDSESGSTGTECLSRANIIKKLKVVRYK